jgi:hypothetical protein
MHYNNILGMAVTLAMFSLGAVSAVAVEKERRASPSSEPQRIQEPPLAGFGERQRRRQAERQARK